MPFQKGKSGNPAGRPVGSKNKSTTEIRDGIAEAFAKRGGVKWLLGLDDDLFCGLLGKVLPKESKIELEGGVTLTITRSFVKAKGEKGEA